MTYLYLTLSLFWFPPQPLPDPCGLSSVICYEESPAYIQEYIRDEFNKAGIDPQIGLKIAFCESRYILDAVGYNKGDNGIDRGLWMINSKWHSEVSDECAFDLECSTKEAIRIIKQRGFKEWTCGRKFDK
jgi:hypothetical protein